MLNALEELDEDAARGAWMKERDHTLDTAARRPIDELDPLRGQPGERHREVGDLEADVMHRRAATLFEETSDARFRVGRLEELDAGLALREEHDLDALLVEAVLLTGAVPAHAAIGRDRVGDRVHHR